MKFNLLILLLTFCITTSLSAQEALKPRPSPLAMVTMKYEDAYVKVTYCQPHKRDRKIFGELVPYGQVWRTGANEATEITTTENILVNNQLLKAGTYTVFTIPQVDRWTIIFNIQLGQWGAYNYSEKADALRVEVPVEEIKDVVYEPFTISFEQRNEQANMVLVWDNTKVSVPIQFPVN